MAARQTVSSRIAVLALLAAALAIGGCAALTAPTAPPTATATGPTDLAAWKARQGFGGASGTRQVLLNVQFIPDHPGLMNDYYYDEDRKDATNLVDWLDLHPPTACWATYHAAIRQLLVQVAAGYDELRDAASDGRALPATTLDAMIDEANAADGMPMPEGCP